MLIEIIKNIARFLYYKNQRKKFFREIIIRKKQDKLIKLQYNANDNALIVFLVPGADWNTGKDQISGGILSIASLYSETKKLSGTHNSKTIMCTFPKDHLLLEHTNFTNDITVFRFSQLRGYFRDIQKMIIHIPELLAKYFITSLTQEEYSYLKNIEFLHINIMNQNINLMPDKTVIDSLKTFTHNITITTAHKKYCTRAYQLSYGVPLHFFSTFASPDKYDLIQFNQKHDLVIFSPDDDEKNREVITLLQNAYPQLKTQVIKGLKYEQYRELIKQSKWSITFGEGLDFYFIEPVFSGSVGFAIYNEEFFTPDFSGLKTIYKSYELMLQYIVAHIKSLNNEAVFNEYQHTQYQLCAKYYSYDTYKQNIKDFYSYNYTFKPEY